MSLEATKIDLLEFFYEHVEEDDWLEGVDLYQAARIKKISNYNGLVTGIVGAGAGRDAEVRLKIHPGGHCIQWIECTCRKYRTKGQYCEHIAALMIHIDRENPQMLGQLDSKMPLKPPAKKKKKKTSAETEEAKTKAGAKDSIIDHLKGSIHSVSLLTKGPSIRVRLEFKEGQLTHYDLPIDDAAKFLIEHPRLKTASPEIKEIKVSKQKAEMATLVSMDVHGSFVAERGILVKQVGKSKDHLKTPQKLKARMVKCCRFDREGKKGREATYEFLPTRGVTKFVGEEYFFIPGRGYFPLDRTQTMPQWQESPIKKVYKNDDAAVLAKTRFRELLAHSAVYAPKDCVDINVIEDPKLFEIKVRKEADGWFTLDPKYGSGDDTISMSVLMDHFSKKKRGYVRSGNTWIKIPELVSQYNWKTDESGQFIEVDSVGLLRLKAAMGDYDHFVGSKTILEKIRNRTEFKKDVKVPPLKDSKLDLRNYQATGLKWLWWLYQNNLHGLLADEMGLGKTHQAMALLTAIQSQKEDGKFLVIAPTTVLDHWYDKILDFAPKLQPYKHHGAKRNQSIPGLGKSYQTIITSYGITLRDIKHLSQIKWDAVVLDEAHFVKNADTATYQAVCKLNADIRVCLTGTPMENHLGELKTIFDFLVPGYLGSDQYFKKNLKNEIEAGGNPEKELELQKLIYPFKLRRTKDLVLKDLPPKVEDIRNCTLSKEQVKLYQSILKMQGKPIVDQLRDESQPIPYLHVFSVLTLLKQICDHPWLVDKNTPWQAQESGKFELLKELLEEALLSNHKIVIYSQYLEMISIIESYVQSMGIDSVTLTGQSRNRGALIKKFQNDENCKIFIGSLLAGGIGVDLTAASVVIHYDRWWNASKENQATDRVHRIGQNKNIQVLKLVCRGTLEEKIDLLIQSKQKMFQKFMDKDDEVFKNLSRQDLIDLLQ